MRLRRFKPAVILYPLVLFGIMGAFFSIGACTGSAPPNNQKKIDDFILRMEQKYKREAFRNPIDLHFVGNGDGRLKVRVTYERSADPTLAASIADAAVELTKRLKREDEAMKDVDLRVDRELKVRE